MENKTIELPTQDRTAVCTIFLLIFLAGFAMQAKLCIDVFRHQDPVGYAYRSINTMWVLLLVFNVLATFGVMIMSCLNTFQHSGRGEPRTTSVRAKIYHESNMSWLCSDWTIYMSFVILAQMICFVLLVVSFSDNTEIMCRNNEVIIRDKQAGDLKKTFLLKETGLLVVAGVLFTTSILSILHVLLMLAAFSEYRTVMTLQKRGWRRRSVSSKPVVV